MVDELKALLNVNERGVSSILGFTSQAMKTWRLGHRLVGRSSIRCIWLTHSLILAPWKLRTLFDLVTWGRYARRQGEPQRTIALMRKVREKQGGILASEILDMDIEEPNPKGPPPKVRPLGQAP